jgi:FkbM family methyltransferase
MHIHLFEILYVLLNRTDLTPSARLSLVARFYVFLFKTKFKLLPKDEIPFAGLKFSHRSLSNLKMMLKDTFFFGEYRLSPKADPVFIIDCGGNIGVTALFFKFRYPKAKVLVFEPAEKNYAVLKKNIEQNYLEGVEAVRAAVCDHAGEMSFWDNVQSPTSSTGISTWAVDKDKFVESRVPAVKLSSYIDRPVDVLKIDIEGGEGLVLEDLDASGKLKEVNEIVMEYHSDKLNAQNKLSKIIDILERNGFAVVPYGMLLARAAQDHVWKKPVYHFMLNAKNTARFGAIRGV